MRTLKIILVAILLIFQTNSLIGQYITESAEGYTPQIGIMVDMLEELKTIIEDEVRELSIEETDFLIDEQANSIGAMIMHIAATEAYIQVESIEGRTWTDEEKEFWSVGGGLGDTSRATIKGKPISYYLELWDEVREKTLEGLKTKDDAWFAANIDENMNTHWAWFHVLKHTAGHHGQIALVKKRLPIR